MEEAAARRLRVTLRYFDGCPNWQTEENHGLTCRVFETPEGLAGSPTPEQLRDALHSA